MFWVAEFLDWKICTSCVTFFCKFKGCNDPLDVSWTSLIVESLFAPRFKNKKKVQQDLESRWDNFGREFAAQEPTFRAFNHFQWHGIWIKEHFESLQSIESPNHTRRNVAGNTSPCECCATFESFRFGFSSISVISIHIPHNVKTKIKVGKLTTWTEWT